MKIKNVKFILIVLSIFQILYTLSGCVKPNEPIDPTVDTLSELKEGDAQMSTSDNTENTINGGNVPLVGISWTSEQALPIFSAPAKEMYTIHTSSLSSDEKVTFSAFQGIVNKTQPRILLTEDGDVPPTTWVKTFNLNSVTTGKYDMIAKFKNEVKGLVVYDISESVHYRNVASTIANIYGYIPVTKTIRESLSKKDVTFSDSYIIDITNWTEKKPIDIYGRLYDEYWKDCSKRLLISADPEHDLDHCRDIAAAANAAVVYLDCTNRAEKAMYEQFMQDMADNRDQNNETAIVLGWFTTERSGIIAGSAYGISTIPSNYYISGSVYSGTTYNSDPDDRTINIPAVPSKNDAENKVYIAIFMTDGDNIQYVQRFMRKVWDSEEERENRGKVAINWTIAPGLVDAGPGLLNYYYSLATDKECFVAGPSGMGYLMPINTNVEPGVKLGNFLTDKIYMDSYTKLTERYLKLSGLRAITIWDDANDDLRKSYEENCRYLYGLTIQDFGGGNVSSGTVNNRLRFIKQETHYEGYYNTILTSMLKNIHEWNGEEPLFLPYQVKVWSNENGTYCRTPQIVKLHEALTKRFGDSIEFVRADHFFALYNEVNNLPFNLCMNSKTTVTSSDSSSNTDSVKDGTPVTVWDGNADNEGKWIQFDFKDTYDITRYVVRYTAGNDNPINKAILQTSSDGIEWQTVATDTNNTDIDTDLEKSVNAQYVKIICEDSNSKIADIEIYGRVVNN